MAVVACQQKQAYDFCVDIHWVDIFFRSFLVFSLYELDVFFGGDWRRELVRGMHVRTVFRFYFCMWYGLYLVRSTVRYLVTDVFSTQARPVRT